MLFWVGVRRGFRDDVSIFRGTRCPTTRSFLNIFNREDGTDKPTETSVSNLRCEDLTYTAAKA